MGQSISDMGHFMHEYLAWGYKRTTGNSKVKIILHEISCTDIEDKMETLDTRDFSRSVKVFVSCRRVKDSF